MKKLNYLFLLLLPLLFSCGETTPTVAGDSVVVKDSLALLNDSIRKEPNNLDLYHARALYYLNRKDMTAAQLDINRVLAIDSSNVKYLLTGADIHFFMNKIQRADQLLKRAVEVEPQNIECLLKLAQLHFYLKRYDEEVAVLNQVLALDRRNAQAYFMRGMIAREQGDTTKAITEMQLAVQMDPDYYNAYILLGDMAAAKKDPLAVDFYANALNVQPTSIEALYHLGMYYQSTEQSRLAVNTYLSILQLDPMHFDAHYNLGYVYTFQLDSMDAGLKYYDLAIRDNPNDARGYFGRGRCYEERGDYTKASADYSKALELNPQFAEPAKALDRIEN
jgi:tetratricopeptide (TPR) repeat protein